MKKVLAMAMLGFAVMIGRANAQPYVSFHAGAVFTPDSTLSEPGFSFDAEYDTGVGVDGAIGNKTGPFRMEWEIGYRSTNINAFKAGGIAISADADVSVLTFMGNAYYDFPVAGKVTPYVGAGLGYAHFDIGDITLNYQGASYFGPGDTDGEFAYQAMAGLSYAVNATTSIEIQYQYLGTSDANFSGVKAKYDSHEIMGGIRYSF